MKYDSVLLQDAKQARPSSVSPESKHFKFCPSATKCLSKAPNGQRLQGLMRCSHLKCDFNSEDEERLHTSIMNRLWDVTLEHQMTHSASEADFEAPLAGTKERFERRLKL
ncbi:uncharacterized protein [Penaeus vannamei]|uniref:uncharacterized protein n=1 Tax=Penaeus vannamei TaxID=6689 RepID=UPI00387F9A36